MTSVAADRSATALISGDLLALLLGAGIAKGKGFAGLFAEKGEKKADGEAPASSGDQRDRKPTDAFIDITALIAAVSAPVPTASPAANNLGLVNAEGTAVPTEEHGKTAAKLDVDLPRTFCDSKPDKAQVMNVLCDGQRAQTSSPDASTQARLSPFEKLVLAGTETLNAAHSKTANTTGKPQPALKATDAALAAAGVDVDVSPGSAAASQNAISEHTEPKQQVTGIPLLGKPIDSPSQCETKSTDLTNSEARFPKPAGVKNSPAPSSHVTPEFVPQHHVDNSKDADKLVKAEVTTAKEVGSGETIPTPVPHATGIDISRPQFSSGSADHSSPGSRTSAVPPHEVRHSLSPVAFHSLRLTEQIAGPELRFTWRSPDSGDIQLSTSLRQHDLQMTVSTDHLDTANALRAELPLLDSRLHEHSLRLADVTIVARDGSLSTGLGTADQQRGQQQWTGVAAAPSNHLESAPDRSDSEVAITTSNARVSVLV